MHLSKTIPQSSHKISLRPQKIDIHRFSKSQQDSLLAAVEKGWITLIGATTENPSFEVISALLSRCQVYTLKPFDTKDLEALLKRAIETDEELSKKKIKLLHTEALLRLSGGDARKLLNIVDTTLICVLRKCHFWRIYFLV